MSDTPSETKCRESSVEESTRYRRTITALRARKYAGEDVDEDIKKEKRRHKAAFERIYRRRDYDGWKEDGREDCYKRVLRRRAHNHAQRMRHPEKKLGFLELASIDQAIFC